MPSTDRRGKRLILVRCPGTNEVRAVGPVYSDNSVVFIRNQAVQAGWLVDGVATGMSFAEFKVTPMPPSEPQ
jgi:hypothetical protein